MRNLLTRKEVAALFEMSPQWVRKHEARLGLDKTKVDLGGRAIRYRRLAVESVLARHGVVSVSDR
jgi:hypothetical protein